MLLSLHVRDLALIEDVEVEFKDGLNILTGETGAGKSLVLGSVNIALGEKCGREVIRQGCESAFVELVFTNTKKAAGVLGELDIPEDDLIIVSRKIGDGRSISKVNGRTVTLSALRNVMSSLIDVYGQHEHESLLNKKNHLRIIDDFAGEEAAALKSEISGAFGRWREMKERLSDCDLNEAERAREIGFCEYEINEIEAANIMPGEDSELEKQFKKMSCALKLKEGLAEISRQIESDDGIRERVSRCVKTAGALAETNEDAGQLLSGLLDIETLVEEAAGSVSRQAGELDFNEAEVYETEKRLDLINSLKAKYGKTTGQILDFLEEKKERLALLKDMDKERERLAKEADEQEKIILGLCERLSKLRKTAAAELAQQVAGVLLDLNFADVNFSCDFKRKESFARDGFDDAQFMISLNPGEPQKPLSKIASGGELSRIMLAVKTVSAGRDETETLIFDEIDAGISGKTAQRLAENLAGLSGSCQVICITHLAQIAAMADAHFVIEKNSENGRTRTRVRELSDEGRAAELARIVGGANADEEALSYARTMQREAHELKAALRLRGPA